MGGMNRIDVGGKLLTNQLKRVLSFRQWDLTAETHIVNRIREQCCYVTTDWKKDMEVSRFVFTCSISLNRVYTHVGEMTV
jgi:actin-related protein 6